MQLTPLNCFLYLLLQFETFQDGIRYTIYKAGENKVVILTYAIIASILLIFLYNLLARRK